MYPRAFAIATVIVTALLAHRAVADDIPGAAKAFSQGQSASAAGDHALAAEMYELADSLAPSAIALRNAAREHLAANHTATAATLASELLQRFPNDKDSRETAQAILDKLTPQLAAINLKCSEPCSVLLDGKVVVSRERDQHAFFAKPGPRDVVAVFSDARLVRKQITGVADRRIELEAQAPPKPVADSQGITPPAPRQPAPRKPSRGGISPWWAISGMVATVGLGGAATYFGVKTLKTRDQIRDDARAGDTRKAIDDYNHGVDQQKLTNIFIGATAGVGLITVTALFFTKWSGEAKSSEHAMSWVPTAGGGSVVWSGRF